jgi:tetratricopeptide (TPR) repeat protein
MRRGLRILLLLVGIVSLGLSVTIVPSAAAQEGQVCAVAGLLVESGQLERAERLYRALDRAGADPCIAQGLTRVARQRRQSSAAVVAGVKALRIGDLGQAEESFKRAQAADAGNAAAAIGLVEVEQRRSPASAADAADRWDKVYTDWVEPATRLVLPFLAVLLVLLVLTRLATRLIGVRPGNKGSGWETDWRWGWGLGLALVISSALLPTVLLPTVLFAIGWTPDRPLGWILAALIAALIAAVGIALMAYSTSWRLRLQIDAHDSKGDADSAAIAFIIARLQALGSEPPRGLEMPEGPDVTELPTDALTTLPEGRVATAVFRVLRVARPIVPWRASVRVIDDDHVAVRLSRNGRLAEAIVVSRQELGLSSTGARGDLEDSGDRMADVAGSRAELLTAVAAFIIVTVAERHTRILKPGLCGATHWDSVALHVIATQTRSAMNDEDGRALLARAVDIDPRNHAARVAYLLKLGRHDAEIEAQQRFAAAMQRERELIVDGRPGGLPRQGFEALEMRMLYSSAAAWINVHLLQSKRGEPKPASKAWSQARDLTELLITRAKQPPRSGVEDFLREIQPSVGYLWKSVASLASDKKAPKLSPELDDCIKEWTRDAGISLNARYDRACFEAEREDGDLTAALDDLELVVGIKHLQDWARTDPSFERIRSDSKVSDRFWQIVGDTSPSDFLSLEPFKDYADSLLTLGIRTPRQLLAHTKSTIDRSRLASQLKANPLVIERMRNVAKLATLVPELSKPALLDLFLTLGIESPLALRTAVAEDLDSLASGLQKAAKGHAVKPPANDELKGWAKKALWTSFFSG